MNKFVRSIIAGMEDGEIAFPALHVSFFRSLEISKHHFCFVLETAQLTPKAKVTEEDLGIS
jgi:hypothetical protein